MRAMSCRSIMTVDPATLLGDATIETAIKALLETRLSAMPVVEAGGRYLGMFGVRKLLTSMLPGAALLDNLVLDLSFVKSPIEEFRARLEEVSRRPIRDHLELEGPILRPEMPIMEAILLLCRSRNILPVVEEEGERLVGVVSSWQAVRAIKGA